MLRNVLLWAVSLAVIGPAVATARTQTRSRFQARLVAKTGESPDLAAAREKFFDDKSAEERFASQAKSTRTGGSCYVCHQKGTKRPHNAFGWAAEQIWLRTTAQEKDMTKAQVAEVFKGRNTAEKNKLAEDFADAAVEALDYWVVLDEDGELKLVDDATDEEGNPLSFRQRVSQGKLPTTDVKGSSYESVFPEEVLEKLRAIRLKGPQ